MSSKKPLVTKNAESLICSLKARPTGHDQASYVGAGVSSYRFLSLSVPQVRAFAEMDLGFAEKSIKEQWQNWNSIWLHSDIYDLLLAAIIWASNQDTTEQWTHRKLLLAWSAKADNWALADSLCSIYATLFEQHPTEMAKVLEKWSLSKNPWERRISNVSLFYYSRSRKRLPTYKFAEKLILRQLADEHYYVQKGVGWALRECWNVYPEKTFALLQKIAGKIPPAAWTAATEKLSPKDKKSLSLQRAESRIRSKR